MANFSGPVSLPNADGADNFVIPSQIMASPTSEVLAVSVGLLGEGYVGWASYAKFLYTAFGELSEFPEILPPPEAFPFLTVWQQLSDNGPVVVHFYVAGVVGIKSFSIRLAAAIYLFARYFIDAGSVNSLTLPADISLDHVLANFVQYVHVTSYNNEYLTGTFRDFPSLNDLRVHRLKLESLRTLDMTTVHPLLALLKWSHKGYTNVEDTAEDNFPPRLLDDVSAHEALGATVAFVGKSHEHWPAYSEFMGKLLKEPVVRPLALPVAESFPFLTIWTDPLLIGHPTIHFYIGANGVPSLAVRLAAAVFLFTQENVYPLVAKDAPSSLDNAAFNHHLANYVLAIDVTQYGETYMMGTFTCTDSFKMRSAAIFEHCQSECSTIAFQYDGCSIVSNAAFAHGVRTGVEAYVQATVHAAWLHFVASDTQGKR
ncbi:hypothetical protein CONPUDRAFT_157548 [Coniophora puteana RWD-64-598 SS2]|uniref:Uncharacterized protein n=1 Tax=Coniophora puteana (strain RWD-64-598) TaxID=741705 RepID=A0A5M3MDT4_CONPW|nr:uncharacterized protein CONPUDRAFT_157548 [Coniophora puteana RWD-64-598 SS2]EIW77293.1 hypothetical protein CONPUDRAFT_157548 [Coniophora puteana RWD-64-598 SS2]